MVARETGAVVDRVEQCIDMVAQHAVMPGPEPHQEWVPRQVLSEPPSLEVLAANRVEIGTCLFQVATFVEERAKVFLLHGAWAIWKHHIRSVVLHQMQCEMHDVSLSGVQEETQASSNYWIASLKKNRFPNYKGCHDSWREVNFDRRGNVRKKPLIRGFMLCIRLMYGAAWCLARCRGWSLWSAMVARPRKCLGL
jgi:hypothetical protein